MIFTVVYDSRYRFSLRMFTSLFVEALSLQTETTSTELRIKLLRSRLQSLVFGSVSRSLFKDDRLMFALHLAHGMHPEQFEDGEWEFFVGAAHKGIARVRFLPWKLRTCTAADVLHCAVLSFFLVLAPDICLEVRKCSSLSTNAY